MTNEQKAQRLDEMSTALQGQADYSSLCAGLNAEGSSRRAIHEANQREQESDAAILREAAGMMRERGQPGWTAQFEREYKGKTLAVVEAGSVGWYWFVDGSPDYEAEIAPTRDAAQAAAVAWVDEREGRDV